MNAVILNDSGFVNGGAAKIALDGARAVALAGHQVHLVCAVGPVSAEFERLPNITVHCMNGFEILNDPNRLRAITYGLWNPSSTKYVAKILDSLSPEETIVHVHCWAKALSSSAVTAALDRGFEVVITLHDFQLMCPNGTLFVHQSQQKCTLRPMTAKCIRTNCDTRNYAHKLWRVGRQAIQQQIGRLPNDIKHFIYYSQLAHDLLAPYLPAGSALYEVPNVIETKHVEAASVAENSTFMFLGRLAKEKGVEMFARAALAEHLPCSFIGEGPEATAIKRANPTAALLGWLSHGDGVQALRTARALVFPSLWYETLGLVVLEAASNGVPSIVPSQCAAQESVINGVTGLYFRSGDEADLRRKLAILNDPQVAERMGKAAHERFWNSSLPKIDLYGQRLEAVYQRMLKGRLAA